MAHPNTHGFTLLEMSIVLMIIGLITGGILYGADLVKNAAVSAQISQINKYNAAVNTFYAKYNAIPGDMGESAASQGGFLTRAGTIGRGNGDGLIEGYNYSSSTPFGAIQSGETVFFWEDLSQAGFIDGQFNTAADNNALYGTAITIGSSPGIYQLLPHAKINKGLYVYVYSTYNNVGTDPGDGNNYFGLSAVSQISAGMVTSAPGIATIQAYNIDKKIDDGFPTSGLVQAQYITGRVNPAPNASSPSAATCYDTTSNLYSAGSTIGTNLNCALSFQFQ